jgi:hypothetical protein
MRYGDGMTFLNLRDEKLDRATQVTKGLPRRRFTVAELEAMVAAGILDAYLEPDFVFYDKAAGTRGLKAGTAHFVVEIADSSFAYDIGRKTTFCGFRHPGAALLEDIA